MEEFDAGTMGTGTAPAFGRGRVEEALFQLALENRKGGHAAPQGLRLFRPDGKGGTGCGHVKDDFLEAPGSFSGSDSIRRDCRGNKNLSGKRAAIA